MCLAFSGWLPVSALMELRLLNKKCGCNCCLSLNNSASLASLSESAFRSFIFFFSFFVNQNKLINDIQVIHKNKIPKRRRSEERRGGKEWKLRGTPYD